MLSAFDITTGALAAQRTRLNAISSNLANINSTRNEYGEKAPYQPRFVVFQTDDTDNGPYGAVGVKVSSIEVDPRDRGEVAETLLEGTGGHYRFDHRHRPASASTTGANPWASRTT